MPRLVKSIPKYRKHRGSGQAVVTLDGRDHYLGPWKTKASLAEYDRLIGEWIQGGRTLRRSDASDLTIAELVNAYRKYADGYYVKDGRQTSEATCFREAARFVLHPYSRTLVVDFGPLALRTVREAMVDAGMARGTINRHVSRLRRMFKWGAAEEMLSASIPQALMMVPGLRKGRTEAREPRPVEPVADSDVQQTIHRLSGTVADVVRVQRLTGCRPAEVCSMRPKDFDRDGDIWAYRPERHKTEHHGRERVVFIGPKCQRILLPYLLRADDAHLFSPAESERKRKAAMRGARKTPVQPSQRDRSKAKPKTKPRDHYDPGSYRRAIHRACDVAGIERWSPNRLRHATATEIRSRVNPQKKIALHVLRKPGK